MTDERTSLLHKRAAARVFLTLGLFMSIVANVMHAEPSLVGRVIAAWPPVALLLTIELISLVPVHSRRMAALRVAAASLVASIAAWVSYWHMAGVAQGYGESVDSAHLFPLTVDGFVVVSSICLFEIAGRLRGLSVDSTQSVDSPDSSPVDSTQVDSIDQLDPTQSTDSSRVDSGVVVGDIQSTESGESTEESRVVPIRRPMAVASRVTEAKTADSKADKTLEYVERIKEAVEAGTVQWPLKKTQIMEVLKIGKSYTDAATTQIKDERWTPQRKDGEVQRERVGQ